MQTKQFQMKLDELNKLLREIVSDGISLELPKKQHFDRLNELDSTLIRWSDTVETIAFDSDTQYAEKSA